MQQIKLNRPMRAGLPVSTSSVFANDANYLPAVAYKQGGGVMRIRLVWLLPGRKQTWDKI